MPELPEVEVTCMGIRPHVLNHQITDIVIRQPQLRWMIPDDVRQMIGQTVISVERRAKYLLIQTKKGTGILHLGMSGKLRVVDASTPIEKHDHVDLVMETGKVVRFNDTRRFGAFLWQAQNEIHDLLVQLGPEPLTDDFNPDYLCQKVQGRKTKIKPFIMDNKVVVGVGNIYATEALFKANIHPESIVAQVPQEKLAVLVHKIKETLAFAIQQGGTTLKDFTKADGNPGYFAQELHAYGRKGEPCYQCGTTLQGKTIGQRNTVFCDKCQTQYK